MGQDESNPSCGVQGSRPSSLERVSPSLTVDEPEDIKEIRRRYCTGKTSSLEVPNPRPALESSRSLEARRSTTSPIPTRTTSSLDNSRQVSNNLEDLL